MAVNEYSIFPQTSRTEVLRSDAVSPDRAFNLLYINSLKEILI